MAEKKKADKKKGKKKPSKLTQIGQMEAMFGKGSKHMKQIKKGKKKGK